MKTSVLSFLCVAAVVTGCASTSLPVTALQPVPQDRVLWPDPPPRDAGILLVARDGGFAGWAARVYLTVNGKKAAEIQAEELLRLPLAPGRHVLTAQAFAALGGETHRPRSLEVTLETGRTTLVRIGFDEMARGFTLWQDAAN